VSNSLFVAAPAKINLFLHVGDKRADGFHDLQSLAVFTASEDALWFEPSDRLTLDITGPFSEGLTFGDDNLVMRAARALAKQTGIQKGAAITLQKMLPVASGIGGGSADAAATLRGLRNLWELDISESELLSVAAELGSDIPVCVASRPAWMAGRGEVLSPAPVIPDLWLLLVNPRVAVPTGPVFAGLESRHGTDLGYPKSFEKLPGLLDFLNTTGNDLEPSACKIAPMIRTVLDRLSAAPGVLLSRMSGSGATCFAIFENADASRVVHQQLADTTDWWVAGTSLAYQPQ
jgi:4-diphosphocytidyl-2-C-methyl-D-erythritol kinase